MEPAKHGTGQPPARLPNGHWLKGQSGNPNGRVKNNLTLTSLLKQQLTQIVPGDKQARTWREVLVQAWLAGAVKNPALMKELLDRVDGKVLVPVGGEGGGPVVIKVVYEQAVPKGQAT